MKRIYLPFFLLVGLLMIYNMGRCQIVNIETKRMQSDTVGWLGTAGASVSLAKNVSQVFSMDVNAHVQYKTEKNLYLMLGNYGFLRGAEQRYIDNAFLHFRYNRKINSWLRWEAFTQLQNNKITRIDSRFLVGTGPRFKLAASETFNMYLGTLLMYEYEKEITDPVIYHRDLRNSNYLSFSLSPSKNIEWVSTSFFQPLFKALNDFRFLTQNMLVIKASSKLSFTNSFIYQFDNNPAGDAPKETYSLQSGLQYTF